MLLVGKLTTFTVPLEGIPFLCFMQDIWAQEGWGNKGMEKTTWQAALCSVILTKYHSGDEVKKTEMIRYGVEERCIQGFSGET
jgi:hypothetical protein